MNLIQTIAKESLINCTIHRTLMKLVIEFFWHDISISVRTLSQQASQYFDQRYKRLKGVCVGFTYVMTNCEAMITPNQGRKVRYHTFVFTYKFHENVLRQLQCLSNLSVFLLQAMLAQLATTISFLISCKTCIVQHIYLKGNLPNYSLF